MDVAEKLCMVLSNWIFLLPSGYLFLANQYYESAAIITAGIFSAMYHVCDDLLQCSIDRELLQFMDFAWFFNIFAIIIVHFSGIPRIFKSPAHFISIVITFLASYRQNIIYFYIAFIVASVLIIIHQLYHLSVFVVTHPHVGCIKNITDDQRKNLIGIVDIICGLIGLAIFGASFVCYALQDKKTYWYLHSLWQLGLGISSFFMLKVGNKVNMWGLQYIGKTIKENADSYIIYAIIFYPFLNCRRKKPALTVLPFVTSADSVV